MSITSKPILTHHLCLKYKIYSFLGIGHIEYLLYLCNQNIYYTIYRILDAIKKYENKSMGETPMSKDALSKLQTTHFIFE